AREREAIMHLWRYCGFLMGVREEYCCATEREGFRLIAMSVGTSPPPDDDARQLAEGYFEAAFEFGTVFPKSEPMQALARSLTRLSTQSRVGTLRLLLGPRDSRALNLPPAGVSMAFPFLLGAATVATQSVSRFIPGAREREARIGRRIHLGIKGLRGQVEPLAYQPYEHREGDERRAPRSFA
ncbi:MAG: DUF2236 domain-containing protein, partial [Polyangiaceae bacterium]|nr:DUF2236 domain-containing protein [Polyangiaceae bacterium]